MYFRFIVRQNNGCLKVSRKFYIVLTSVISPVSHRPHFALPADCTHHSNHSIGKYRLTIQVTPSPGTFRLFLSQCGIYRYVLYSLKKKTCIPRTPGFSCRTAILDFFSIWLNIKIHHIALNSVLSWVVKVMTFCF